MLHCMGERSYNSTVPIRLYFADVSQFCWVLLKKQADVGQICFFKIKTANLTHIGKIQPDRYSIILFLFYESVRFKFENSTWFFADVGHKKKPAILAHIGKNHLPSLNLETNTIVKQ